MIELPEALTLAREITSSVVGKTVISVSPPTKPHKFCRWNGNPGGYKTVMSKSGAERGCPLCLGPIVREAYLGGSVYYCPSCQK